jgi:hypothetical protein
MSELELSDEEFVNLPIPEEAVEDTPTEALEEPTEDDSTESATTPQEGEDNGLQDQETQEEVDIDYKSAYAEVFKPFKANGKEMKVDSVDDVRQLMQMGANYNKKMAALKPNLKVIKMLESNDLLDAEKLSYLIDLHKKNPEAIHKLLKDSAIDPLDVDMDKELSYKPSNYTVTDSEIELDSVLSELKETPTYSTTIDIIGNKWDAKSRQVLIDNPNVIKIINDHVASGVYKNITDEVERMKVLGKLDGLSDIEAYKAVGDAMYAPKGTNNINTSTSQATNSSVDPKLKDRKRAASSTKSVVGKTDPNFNPLSMSDEEFEKLASSKFI